ncbi:MAG TPA: hypothetical protein VFR58_11055 [Flavisolibacter sp.]|nr:hypothetical protein [Flavisolibacter sp.]
MQTNYMLNPGPKVLFQALIYGLAALYLASCFTPLHLHIDSVRYYNIKDCLEFGCEKGSFADTDYLPYGYTALLILLSKLGVLSAFSIVLVNCFYIFGALWLLKKLLTEQVHPLLLVSVALLNWTIIKFAAHPLSEMQYIFFSSASLYCFHRYIKKKSFVSLGFAFLFALLTTLTRAVGISLVGALCAGIVWQHKDELLRIIKKNKLVLVVLALVLVVVVFFARQLKLVDYTSLLKEPLEQGIGNFVLTNLRWHFTEITEVFLNIPFLKVQGYVPGGMGKTIFVLLGILLYLWFLLTMFSKRSTIPAFIRIYLVFYSLIIFNWPYYDPRFWVPVLPLMVAVMLQAPFNRTALTRLFGRVYFAVYAILGLVAVAYGLYVGLDKERFARQHAAGYYRNEYEIHFFGKTLSDTAVQKDSNVIEILKRYD